MKIQRQIIKQYTFPLIVAAAVAGLSLPLQAQNANSSSSGSSGTQSSGSSSGGTQGSSSSGSSPSQSSKSPATQFLKQAQISSEYERQAAELGLQRAQNPQLKQFSQQLLQQHAQSQQSLQSLAQQKGLQANEPLPKRLTQKLSKLDRETGPSFDQALATDFLKENAQSVQHTQKALSQLQQEPQVERFAQMLLREQQQHVEQAAQVAQTVGVSQKTISSAVSKTSGSMGGTGESQTSGSSSGQQSGSSSGSQNQGSSSSSNGQSQGGRSSSNGSSQSQQGSSSQQ